MVRMLSLWGLSLTCSAALKTSMSFFRQ